MREVAITAVGADRPGIVAAITGALHELRGNLEDCRAALLRGSFAMVVVVALADDVTDARVREVLEPVARRLGMGLWVGPAEHVADGPPHERAVVSVYGADHPGIVHAVTSALAERGVNVVDLSSRVVGDPPIYTLAIEVELPEGLDADGLAGALAAVADAQAVELAVSPVEDGLL